MKKGLVLFYIFPLILSGCNLSTKNQSSDYQTIKYGEALSTSEKTKLYSDASNELKYLVYAEKSAETSYSTVLNNITGSTTEKYDVYTNSLKVQTKTTGHVIANDIEYDVAPEQSIYNYWQHTIGTRTRYISYSVEENVAKNLTVSTSANYSISYQLFGSLFAYGIDNYLAFRANGGYEMVYSSHQRTVNYIEVGGQSRENISETKAQQILHFNLSKQLEWATLISSSILSVDPETGEWYGGTKEVLKSSTKIEYTYGSVQKRDGAELKAVLGNKNIVWGIDLYVKTARYTSASLADNDFTVDSSCTELSYTYNGLDNSTVTFRITFNNNTSATNRKNAILSKLSAFAVLYNGTTEGTTSFSNVTFSLSNQLYFSQSTTSNGTTFYYFTGSYSYTMTFELQYSSGSLHIYANANY